MTSDIPPKHNAVFKAPDDMDQSQVHSIPAFKGTIPHGSNLDGADFVVVAWRPDAEDLKRLLEGGMVYLTCLGGLPPHFLSTYFSAATYGEAE